MERLKSRPATADTPLRGSVRQLVIIVTFSGRRGGRLRSEAGFTLFEVLIASVVLVLGLAVLLGLLNASVKAGYQTRAREGAVALAREVLEDAHSLPYSQISPTSIESELQTFKGLANTSGGSTWQVTRRESLSSKPLTYTIAVSECSIDDPKDGLGNHTTEGATTFCEGSRTEGKESESSFDTTPVDMKRVTVAVKWTAQGRAPEVKEVAMISTAGEALGLIASELQLSEPKTSAPTKPVITEASVKELTFTVTAPSSASAMSWSLNGVAQSPAPTLKAGTTWTFKWKIEGLSDGVYSVSAQAINSQGVIGPPVTISVTLLRNVPAAPKGIKGGFNEVYVSGQRDKVIELKWEANTELNVIGYRVYKPGPSLACPESSATLSLETTCTDFKPSSTGSSNTYTLVALYRNTSGEVTEGTSTTFTVTYPPAAAPNPPASLSLSSESGALTLSWPFSTGGTGAIFYRVYRTSTAATKPEYADRYAIAYPGSEAPATYTDRSSTSKHKYWVTSVNSNLTESEPTGPVEG
jgi:Tfp pilus assembly protein PilV